MKKLTYSAMAAARLRANKKQYISLILGIFLSIFLVTSLVMGVYGIYLAFLEDRYDRVGSVDMVALEHKDLDRQDLEGTGLFQQIGSAYITGKVNDREIYIGSYDPVGQELMNLYAIEGRLPESAGELAIEKSALDVLEVQWSLGETVALDILPLDGQAEQRGFTLVGFLPERSTYFAVEHNNDLNQFPALAVSSEEPAFAVGRVGTHYVMTLREGISLNTGISTFEKMFGSHGYNFFNYVYGLTVSGQQQMYAALGGLMDAEREMFTLIGMACALGSALILSCGVGISVAMEGLLSGRREEIGVLRALGATRRQIRRIFGRENLILSLIVSPLSMGIGCLAVWGLSVLIPDKMIFGLNLSLLVPIAVFSVAVVLLSGYLPLNRASKLMPMSVIRDTAMLRRNKKVKTKKRFTPARLIASRQIRFNPTRQIGAMLLVGLMLLCSGLLVYLAASFTEMSMEDLPGFELRRDGYSTGQGQIYLYNSPTMSDQSIAQIRGLDGVKSVAPEREMPISLLLDKVPRYAVVDDFNSMGMYDEQMLEAAMAFTSQREWLEWTYPEKKAQYQDFLKAYEIPGHSYRSVLSTVTLDSRTLNSLQSVLTDGHIDVDAINRGEQVIVMAPEIWVSPMENGSRGYYSEESAARDPNAIYAAWNDTFEVGDSLSLMQLYQTEEDGPVHRNDETVTIGAVTGYVNSLWSPMANTAVLTTEQGLRNMALRAEGLNYIEVYVDSGLSLAEEELLESRISAIVRRTKDYSVYNRMAAMRENDQASRQTILLFFAVTVLFFAVAVGMIVSSVTRQLNSEGRTIGMLRAVGADEKAILGCYSGQINASVVGGLCITVALLMLYGIVFLAFMVGENYIPSMMDLGEYSILLGMPVLTAAGCWLACRCILRLRVRRIVSRSIIENIKEL